MSAVADSSIVQNVVTARPYSPSWVDRFTDWVRRLPGPAWLFYLGVASVLVLTRTIIAWIDGSYSAGTFFPFHIVDQANSAYLLFVLYYLDGRAGEALAAFRPVLRVGADVMGDAVYERLRYQLTTMPARPALAWSFAGLLFGLAYLPLLVPDDQLRHLNLFTSPTALAFDFGLSGLNWMVNAIFAYHTIHQLRLVSRIYTEHTNVNVFETGPLYALSRITAITAIALLFITYLYASFWVNWRFETVADAAIVLAFVLIALATFVWPVLGAHRLLHAAKEHRKSEVARHMEAITDELHRRTHSGDYSDMANMDHAVGALVKEQDALDKISTWPWEPEAVRGVGTALLLPIVLWLVTRVLERLGF